MAPNFKSKLNFILLLFLLPFSAQSQHCCFEGQLLCVITISDSLISSRQKLQIALADFDGNKIPNTLITSPPHTAFTGQKDPEGLFFYPKRLGQKILFSRYIFEKYPLNQGDYLMLIPKSQLEEIFQKTPKVYLQISDKKGNLIYSQNQISLGEIDFHYACTGEEYWDDKEKLEQMKILIR